MRIVLGDGTLWDTFGREAAVRRWGLEEGKSSSSNGFVLIVVVRLTAREERSCGFNGEEDLSG